MENLSLTEKVGRGMEFYKDGHLVGLASQIVKRAEGKVGWKVKVAKREGCILWIEWGTMKLG